MFPLVVESHHLRANTQHPSALDQRLLADAPCNIIPLAAYYTTDIYLLRMFVCMYGRQSARGQLLKKSHL